MKRMRPGQQPSCIDRSLNIAPVCGILLRWIDSSGKPKECDRQAAYVLGTKKKQNARRTRRKEKLTNGG